MGDRFGTSSAADKSKAWLRCGSMLAKKMDSQLFPAQGEYGLCFGLIAGDHCEDVPQSTGHLNGAQPCGAMKMAKSCEGRAAAKLRTWVSRSQFELHHRHRAFTAVPLFKLKPSSYTLYPLI